MNKEMMDNKKLVLLQCAYKCVICKVFASEVVNISRKLRPDIGDLAPLCEDCNNLFGDNPKKWKKIKLMRDWLKEFLKSQSESIIYANVAGINYGIVSKELRNYLINPQILMPMSPNKYDSFEAFKYVLQENVNEARLKFGNKFESALVIDLFDQGMKRKQKRDYYRYLKKGIIDDYLYFFQEIHLPHCSIIKVRDK